MDIFRINKDIVDFLINFGNEMEVIEEFEMIVFELISCEPSSREVDSFSEVSFDNEEGLFLGDCEVII